MQTNSKSALLKKIVLLENVVLLLLTLVSVLLIVINVSAGVSVFFYSNFILYPFILISFFVGLILKIVEMGEYKLNFVLFGVNLAMSFVCLLAMLYKFADVLGSF